MHHPFHFSTSTSSMQRVSPSSSKVDHLLNASKSVKAGPISNNQHSLYRRSFTCLQNRTGIFLDPAIDIVLLVKHCSHFHGHDCVDCRDFQLGSRLGRYNDTKHIRVVAFDDHKLLECKGSILEFLDTFLGIEHIILKVDCLVDEFRHIRKRRKCEIEDAFRRAKERGAYGEHASSVSVTLLRFWDDLLCWDTTQMTALLPRSTRTVQRGRQQWSLTGGHVAGFLVTPMTPHSD
jgi:hypothetical protein